VTVSSTRVTTGKIVPLVQQLLPTHEMALAGRRRTQTVDVWVVAALGLVAGLEWQPLKMQQLEDTVAHEAAALALARVAIASADWICTHC
jgi:hypothetical protein